MSKVTKNEKNKNFYAFLSVWSSIIGNTILFGLKFWAGTISGSVAVIADAWHTLSDSISSVIVLIGVKISQKKPTQKHPFGFGRADTIASVILSVLLAIIAFEFLIKGIEKLQNHQEAEYNKIVLIIFIVSILFKEAMAQISFYGAKKSGKKSLKADGWHHRSDAIASLVIIAGIIISKWFWWIDGVLGIIVAIIIFITAFEILKETAIAIIGVDPDFETKQQIKKVINKAAEMKTYPHHIHLHSYGQHQELTLHVYLPKDTTIEQAHNLTDKMEQALADELNMVATIHVEPLPENINKNKLSENEN